MYKRASLLGAVLLVAGCGQPRPPAQAPRHALHRGRAALPLQELAVVAKLPAASLSFAQPALALRPSAPPPARLRSAPRHAGEPSRDSSVTLGTYVEAHGYSATAGQDCDMRLSAGAHGLVLFIDGPHPQLVDILGFPAEIDVNVHTARAVASKGERFRSGRPCSGT